ncbi:MAG: iron transporter [Synergistales bacterium]|nr:iron transporter [Synergistales bacterium]MDY6400739.1 iron transporter [Synergistales bacterium]MDY6404585.1 iron transporter [Synergistales bacterium]MDY6411211.1 iron transporter [Synergistales bacterium]MDY6413591.1 iron transporter [Synergistales bacterium]
MKKLVLAVVLMALSVSAAFAAGVAAPVSMKPGEAGFEEIPIGETQVGPYNVAAVYFQAVDMYPTGKGLSREESDMHLEADIHLKPEAAIQYGFGNGEDIWPAYLTVKYEIAKIDGKVVMDGSFMPMNADDGPHYGANIAKGLPVGPYKLRFIIEPPTDYLLHIDDETGVPAKEGAKEFFKTHTVEFDWNYTAEQLQND